MREYDLRMFKRAHGTHINSLIHTQASLNFGNVIPKEKTKRLSAEFKVNIIL